MEITPDTIEKGFESMPPELRKAVREVDVSKTLHEICQKYHLHMDIEGSIVSEAWYVILGFKQAEDFSKEVGKVALIPQDQFSALLSEINDHVFAKIRARVLEIRQQLQDEAELENQLEASKSEEELFHESGVELEQSVQKTRPSDSVVPNQVLAREDMLAQIETPTPSTPTTLSSVKLEAPHGLPPTQRTMSLEKPPLPGSTPPPPPRSADPYKEPIG